jgi:hypothetical protein
VETSWLTDVKGIVSYTIPNIGIQVAGTFQSNPGTEIVGNATFTNADVQASLGRPLSGNAQTISVNIVPPGQSYGDRLNNLDLRVGKILRFGGRRRTGLNFEVYNSLNSDAVLREGTNYSSFRAASSVVGGRLYKFSLQLDF